MAKKGSVAEHVPLEGIALVIGVLCILFIVKLAFFSGTAEADFSNAEKAIKALKFNIERHDAENLFLANPPRSLNYPLSLDKETYFITFNKNDDKPKLFDKLTFERPFGNENCNAPAIYSCMCICKKENNQGCGVALQCAVFEEYEQIDSKIIPGDGKIVQITLSKNLPEVLIIS